jgi:hypothetical protein
MTGRRGIWIAGIGLAVVLVLFGIQLHDTQTTMRRDIEARFRDRAEVTSALTDSVFSAIASPQSAAPSRAPVVSDALLDTAVSKGQLHYAVLLDGDGRTIARSRGFAQYAARSLAGRFRLAAASPPRQPVTRSPTSSRAGMQRAPSSWRSRSRALRAGGSSSTACRLSGSAPS